jgi:protein O-GlcNAc transferase
MTQSKLSESKIQSIIDQFSSGQLHKALESSLKLINDYPSESLLLNIAGACYAGLEKFDIAVEFYNKAIMINPNYAKAHYNLGGALHELGQLDESVKSYESSLLIEPDYAQAYNNLGNVFRELGQLDDSLSCYKKSIKLDPNYAEAFFSASIIFQDLGQFEDMVEYLEQVLILKPNFSEAHNYLGSALKELGQYTKAISSYQKALEIEPNYLEVHNNLGNAFKNNGELEKAIESYQKALTISPDYPTLHNNLGNALKEFGEIETAIKCYKKAIDINPDFADSYNNLGDAFRELNQFDNAVDSYEKAINLDPNYFEAFNNLGTAFKDLDRLNDAVSSYEQALKINPEFSDAYNNLGNVLKKLGKLDEALESYEMGIAMNPNDVDIHNNLGRLFSKLMRIDEALQSYNTALKINPQHAETYKNLGIIFMKLDRLDESFKHIEKALSLNPEYAEGYSMKGRILSEFNQLDEALVSFKRADQIDSNLYFILSNILQIKMSLCDWNNLPELLNTLKSRVNNNEKHTIIPFDLLSLIDDPRLQRMASENYIKEDFPRNYSVPNSTSYPKHKKIRIGYFSSDFRIHPVATLTAELYETHDRSQFEIHAFSFGPDTGDEMNMRIKAGVDHFHNILDMSEKDSVVLARSLEIDIAIDLGGFTGDSRTGIFAMRVSPIQISYIGYLGTMGSEYYDYLIADQIMIPKKYQQYYSEKIIYLPNFQVNDSKESSPNIFFTRKDIGLPEEGFIFCCLNNTYKINPSVFDSWANILVNVKDSVLLIYADHESSKVNLIKEIKNRGLDSNRLFFAESFPRIEYLARYRIPDLFLDTWPYNAGTTASDALRMGLPVLTLMGESYPSRMAGSILNAANLPELITTSVEEYESLAIELGSNPNKHQIIKKKLESSLSKAPLYDTALFTRSIEFAFKEVYQRDKNGLRPENIYVDS